MYVELRPKSRFRVKTQTNYIVSLPFRYSVSLSSPSQVISSILSTHNQYMCRQYRLSSPPLLLSPLYPIIIDLIPSYLFTYISCYNTSCFPFSAWSLSSLFQHFLTAILRCVESVRRTDKKKEPGLGHMKFISWMDGTDRIE